MTGARPSPVSDSAMTTYGDLPADIQGHLLDLETFIGDCDGQWTALQTSDANVVLDNGTIDAGDAVKAFNGIVAALRARSSAGSAIPRFVPDEPFDQNISGPNVSLRTVYPVVECGPGWMRVIALASTVEAQDQILDALNDAAQCGRDPQLAEIDAWIESIGRITPEIRQRILDVVDRLDKCRDSRPLVYALSHNDPLTVGDLRSVAIAISSTEGK